MARGRDLAVGRAFLPVAGSEEPVSRVARTGCPLGGRTGRNACPTLEALAVFAACQFYLWWVHARFRYGWVLLLAYMISSVAWRRESEQKLGLSLFGSASGTMRWAGWPVILVTLPLLAFGYLRGRLGLQAPDAQSLLDFGGYLAWCVLQQFALQSFLHNRLMDAFPGRPHFTAALTALMFSSLHLPNPVLVVATLVGGFAMAEIFARRRNIWVLAALQALVSTVIFVSLPDEWHHRLRVGAGFYWWEVRR